MPSFCRTWWLSWCPIAVCLCVFSWPIQDTPPTSLQPLAFSCLRAGQVRDWQPAARLVGRCDARCVACTPPQPGGQLPLPTAMPAASHHTMAAVMLLLHSSCPNTSTLSNNCTQCSRGPRRARRPVVHCRSASCLPCCACRSAWLRWPPAAGFWVPAGWTTVMQQAPWCQRWVLRGGAATSLHGSAPASNSSLDPFPAAWPRRRRATSFCPAART